MKGCCCVFICYADVLLAYLRLTLGGKRLNRSIQQNNLVKATSLKVCVKPAYLISRKKKLDSLLWSKNYQCCPGCTDAETRGMAGTLFPLTISDKENKGGNVLFYKQDPWWSYNVSISTSNKRVIAYYAAKIRFGLTIILWNQVYSTCKCDHLCQYIYVAALNSCSELKIVPK